MKNYVGTVCIGQIRPLMEDRVKMRPRNSCNP